MKKKSLHRKSSTVRPQQGAGNTQGQSANLPGSIAANPPSEPSPEEIQLLMSLMRQGRYTDGETSAREMTERFPDFGFAWKILGTSFLLQGRNEEALDSLLKAVSLLPEDPILHSNLGLIYYELASYDTAENHCRLALHFRPDDAIAHNNLGNILQAQGRLDEAESCFRRARDLNPNVVEAHYNLGHTLQMLGRLDEAENCYRRALEIRPQYAEAYENLGNIQKERGYLNEALANWKLSLKYKDWQEALKRVTYPLLIDSDLVRGPQYPAADFAEEQVLSLKHRIKLPLEPSYAEMLEKKYLIPSDRLAPSSENDSSGNTSQSAAKKLRIVFIYPPPWQIPSVDLEIPEGMPFGPPASIFGPLDVNDEGKTISQGLLSIAAQAQHAGHVVSVYNLSDAPWIDVVSLIAASKADIYGISAYDSNRRGTGAVCAAIRKHHPKAHITVGGPFATILPLETLRYYREIDTVVIGEGEETFMELLEHVDSNRPAIGIPGTAWRNNEDVLFGPDRPFVNNLDTLVSPFDYYSSNFVMTSRGCPSKCTFCANPVLWRKRLRFHSPEYCLSIIRKALARLPVPYIMIADDTFTSHKKRTVKICDAFIDNKINFLWDCHTRADVMDDELLRKMRLAGCQSIFIGVESGSQEILNMMHKKTTPAMVLQLTRAARKYGMHVHYFMILGNRGETPDSINQSIDLIKAGRPNSYDLTPLQFLPGTEDWEHVCRNQGLTADILFRNDVYELSVVKGRDKDFETVFHYVLCGIGNIYGFEYTIEEREAVLDHLPELPIVHVELAHAYFRHGQLDKAEAALYRAEDLGFPIGNMLLNQHANICLARNQIDKALHYLETACQAFPDKTVKHNLDRLTNWIEDRSKGRAKKCMLVDSVQVQGFTST
ncbi:MAG: tetratricopeptide repeat protein [Desulfobulbaceae bacterium]|nr:tetratricopeptide repeat protein [Desulfobulbaceae bacterium]